LIVAEVPVADGRSLERGEFQIAGVPGSGACIRLDFADTVGSLTGRILPTGSGVDYLANFGGLPLSAVDVAIPMVFVPAASLGVRPTDGPDELDSRKEFIETVEKIRVEVASRIGLAKEDGSASGNVPVFAVVAPPADYLEFGTQRQVPAEAMDVWCRAIWLGVTHKAYGVTDTICTAVAALIPGTVVHTVTGPRAAASGRVRIGHPSGVIEAEVAIEWRGREPLVRRAVVGRTARRIMDGVVWIAENA
jgi:2-methylaconitate cis-trans-isomerase PrpF